ncbi:MAG: carbon-nitrogen hydrolase family protein [Thermoplasmata archaeon]|nr:carbon-nitrogen hydrolase family protein [Thermoplasmata archaeon]MCI4355574.1 carbon-nitrogen hydrolase family protein [Thermoplasmata archaeon]
MEVALAELAPVPGEVATNVARAVGVLNATSAPLTVLPELFLSGYRIGDRFHTIGLRPTDPRLEPLRVACRSSGRSVVLGAPTVGARRGEVANSVVLVRSDGTEFVQIKRYLPTYGPFEEGATFTPTDTSAAAPWGDDRLGLSICYDAFFPEVFRTLALDGATVFICVSAAPVTSGRLFGKVLPARAVENACPLVYVNRSGVEDGVVFGGGSVAYDARGEPLAERGVEGVRLGVGERLFTVEVDPTESARWRPFRPVLRDVAQRPGLRSGPSTPTSVL